ncbi:MAG: zinc-binding dehydrogenase [Actinomycetota bacterium]|nr:zinc-binding dehydrogenase [Actinomycetota bacterium]
MQVVQATRFGGPEVLMIREVPDPVAGPGQVVVDVSVADTLHLDTVIRRGQFPFPVVEPPYVPGAGVAGEVASVGEEVDGGWAGRRVVVRTGVPDSRADTETVGQLAERDTHAGGYAERAVVATRALIPVPDELGLREAAALINDGMTAMLLFEVAQVRPGEWVLITPAGGGLGSLLVQLAQASGARVVGAARGERKLDLARELGAEAVVDYSREGWPERVREATDGKGPDVVLDGVGGQVGRASFEVTARGGRFVAYGAPSGEFAQIDPKEADQHAVAVVSLFELELTAADEKRLIERALSEVAASRIRPVIGQTFPLEQAADAHAAIEAREVIGKTLLLI